MTAHITAFTACLAIGMIAFAAAASLPPHHARAAIVTTHTGD